MQKRIVITDLTRMDRGNICIAGIDEKGKTIRPVIPYQGIPETYIYNEKGETVVCPFNELEFSLGIKRPEPPHIEDQELNLSLPPLYIRTLSEEERTSLLSKNLSSSLNDIFGCRITENRYLKRGEGRRSLGTISLKAGLKVYHLPPREDGERDRIRYRITFQDEAGIFYNLPVTDLQFIKECEQRMKEGGCPGKMLAQYTSNLSLSRHIFLRIGLTRPFGKEERQYIQVNGIYGFR